jgi:hypothetical protein
MNINEEIKSYLKQRADEAVNDFLKIDNPHPLFIEIFSELEQINRKNVQQGFVEELKRNCKEYWTNEEEGFNPEEKVQVLLFEYDDYTISDPEALAYGIMGKGFKIKSIPYEFGNDYEFVSSIEANYGITLTTFSPLAKLGDNTPPEYEDYDFYDEEGYIELKYAYVFSTYLILHEAIGEFVMSDEFKLLSTEKILHFMIGEHDCSNEQSIYYAYNNVKDINKAIKEQGESTNGIEVTDTYDLKNKIDTMINDGKVEEIEEILKGLKILINHELTQSWAAMKLSKIYKKGFGVEANFNTAVEYMEIAAQDGSLVAKANIGLCYYAGQGKTKDLNKALELLTEADNYYLFKGEYTKIIEQIKLEIEQGKK